MAKENYHKKESKNVRALFSVVCLCVISLGLIVYFSATNSKTDKPSAVNEHQTLVVTSERTTEVQHAVTVTEPVSEEAPTETQAPSEPTTKKEAESMPQGKDNIPYKSYYKYPLTEAVARGYTEELVYDATMGDYRAHAAVDFKGSEDDPVCAINDGIVLDAYIDNMRGGVVEIDHGGNLTATYCGLKSLSVTKGKRVTIGNKIGTLGSVPAESAEGVHLHFETRLDGQPVNPLDVMGKTE